MTFITHRRFAVGFAVVGCMVLYQCGMKNINYYLALMLTVMCSKVGGLFPDVDHQWDNVKEKTVTNWIVNKIIHITGGKHRSWQTHSLDIVVIFVVISSILPGWLFKQGYINVVDKEILSVMMVGFSLGWVSHIVADMLNHAGVRLVCWNRFKISFVPKSLFGLQFKTGDTWENFVCKICGVVNFVTGLVAIVFPFKDSIAQFMRTNIH